ncbi:MAG: radical SAM protein [Myxococcota bacterium]
MGTFSAGPAPAHDGIVVPFDGGYRKVPSLVQWMITGHCSGSCPHCMTSPGRSARGLDRDSAMALLDDIARMGVDELLLTGGEPLERQDLPELIDAIRDRNIRWSLNTARFPTAASLRAMKRWPPCFAAVSLDGPAEIHDLIRGWRGAQRESLEAMRVFAELTNGHVAAGTTVSQRTFPTLAETFPIVLDSGASSWGLHLVVPEGRAARSAALSTHQLQSLVRFVADKRSYFPVTLADELGYCGTWEPLVRDTPFFCGAGRTQCVVLPDGDVVPCTTFDRRERAGNVCERPLSEIWPRAFAHLRGGEMSGACRTCAHAQACGGGCWLQRRHGVHCHRAVWERPGLLSTRAGVAVCLGLAACSPPEPETAKAPNAQSTPAESTPAAAVAPSASAANERNRAVVEPAAPAGARDPLADPTASRIPGMTALDRIILDWYAARLGRPAPELVRRATEQLRGDPAQPFLQRVLTDGATPPWPERASQVRAALGSSQRSLHLVSLLWRDLATWSFDGPAPGQRSTADQQRLADLITELGAATERWREDIFARRLHPFLHRGDPANRRSFLSKAGPPLELRLAMRSAGKHWDADAQHKQVTRAWLQAHPFAASMALTVRIAPGDQAELRGHGSIQHAASIGIFDVLTTAPGSDVVLRISHGSTTLPVRIPAGVAVTYPDLLRLVHEQNESTLAALMQRRSAELKQPLLLPAYRAELERLETRGAWDEHARMLRRLLDAWLF